VVLPYADAQVMTLPLDESAAKRRKAVTAYCSSMEPAFGKLGRHKMGEKPRAPGNISLLQLPCYSP
jgi:hypothetical protein